jgi:hypothetical protein
MQRMQQRGSVRLAVVMAAVLGGAIPESAGAADAATCAQSELQATGYLASNLARAHSRALRRGTPVAPDDVGRAIAGFERRFSSAGSGTCAAPGESDRIRAEVQRMVATLLESLDAVPPAPSACTSRQLAAAGHLARRLLQAHARRIGSGDAARLTSDVAGLGSDFASAFARAEYAGDCLGRAAASVAREQVDLALDFLLGALAVVHGEKVWLPSASQPAQTPGTPGVVVTNPKLITQFGGASFDLNRAGYTRWRLLGPAVQPDAILVLVHGFGGGSNNYKILVENLITRMAEERGLQIEAWAVNLRSDQLEDRAGAVVAEGLGDASVALDWYYGGAMGLPLGPALAAGPNRRAVFYNKSNDVPFVAQWTPQVFSQDLDAVISQARALARNGNVFLGGHSAGTGFAARYAATDFNASGIGAPDAGYAKLRGIVLLEGGGGTALGPALTADSLDRMIARFDGGLFGAVRDQAGRCVDGVTGCTVASEAIDCAGQLPPVCTPPVDAHGGIAGITAEIGAASEIGGIQARSDPNTGQALLQVDVGGAGSAIATVPGLALLGALPPATAAGMFGLFLDDEGVGASLSRAVATAMGGPGGVVGGLFTWRAITQPPLPAEPDNGPAPTALPAGVWGQEVEVVRVDRLAETFVAADSNASDWYYPTSGLSVTSAPGVCSAGTCVTGDVGASCTTNTGCSQSISLDSTALSVGRGRRDIANLTQAGAIDVPVLCIGGSNGLAPVGASFLAFGQSIATCATAGCDGVTPRVVSAASPSPAFPTYGGVAGGFEVHIVEGFAHNDVLAAEDSAQNPVIGLLAEFVERNLQ